MVLSSILSIKVKIKCYKDGVYLPKDKALPFLEQVCNIVRIIEDRIGSDGYGYWKFSGEGHSVKIKIISFNLRENKRSTEITVLVSSEYATKKLDDLSALEKAKAIYKSLIDMLVK